MLQCILQFRPALGTAGVLTLVYSFLFVVLQLQDYAVLVSNLGLVLALSVVMLLSSKLDWDTPVANSVERPDTTYPGSVTLRFSFVSSPHQKQERSAR
ncbi:inner membrane CreD family protein [Hymenobacter arizonensis]|uniref:inner membrane CreD family protein n=1 Tax=Hymenobacter arizonensis TaxID=1227077 RepID=UPI000B88256F|nr:inner membrane CreD family protein [Hymenobacter arizonensis]